MQINFYEVMGVPRDCPQESIAQAFRNRARQVHPDKCREEGRQDETKQATILLIEAYRVLNNPVLRREYDIGLQAKLQASEFNTHRYFEHTSILHRQGKLFVECEQCAGETEIAEADLLRIAQMERHSCFVKCWHCGLSLAVDLE
jgi:curved DNA-binding protein CbpA